jgi:hypothetical protein
MAGNKTKEADASVQGIVRMMSDIDAVILEEIILDGGS